MYVNIDATYFKTIHIYLAKTSFFAGLLFQLFQKPKINL